MFEYIHKLSEIKNCRLKLKSMWLGKKRGFAGGFFTIVPAGDKFRTLSRSKVSLGIHQSVISW